jgi:FkbM family methyltransferase
MTSAIRWAIRRLGLTAQARYLVQVRTKRGRRGLRDDRQLAFFMASTISHNANCIDVGAHKGWVLHNILTLAPDGRHMAFEPIPHLAAHLATTFPNVDVRDVALGDEPSETVFHVADAPELSGLQPREWLDTGYSRVPVSVRRLDDVVPLGQRVDFVKVDVEGAQVRVLLGAARILADQHPTIWIEHGTRSAAAYGSTTEELWTLLTDNGYRVWTADGQGPLDLAQMQAANDLPMWTYMAHV